MLMRGQQIQAHSMAQTMNALSPSSKTTNGASHPTPEELSQMIEYEKIVQFRDSVLAGTHPRVKLPLNLGTPLNLSETSIISNGTTQINTSDPINAAKIKSGPNNEISTAQNNSHKSQPQTTSCLSASNNSGINPVLLEKSDDLIKAELQLQRQRLEKALREQVEHQRIATKALLQTSESLPDFNVSEVLSKALSIAPPSTAENVPPVSDGILGYDSFDDNTFYSSKNDTPSPSNSSHASKNTTVKNTNLNPADGQYLNQMLKEANKAPASESYSLEHNKNVIGQGSGVNKLPQPTRKHIIEHRKTDAKQMNAYRQGNQREEEKSIDFRQNSSDAGFKANRREICPNANTTANNPWPKRKASNEAFSNEPQPRQVRNHNLPLVAPQPERVSPLATNPLVLGEITDEGQPVQATSLRQIPTISSTESSPRVKNHEKIREKKRTRQAKDISMPGLPYIKAEPKSPSSYASTGPPQKRHRGQYASQSNNERSQPYSDMKPQERIISSTIRRPRSHEQRLPYDTIEYDPRYRQFESNNVTRRISSGPAIRRPQSSHFASPYLPGVARSKPQSVLAGGRYLDDREYIREPLVRASVRPDVDYIREPVVRASVRPDVDYIREPVVRASVRPGVDYERSRSPIHEAIPSGSRRQIIVNDHVRQYYNVTPAPSIGQTIPSSIRYRDDELLYERIPTRTVPSRAPTETYENDGYLIRRRSPAYAVSRRVITQPEYISVSSSSNYRPHRQGGYSYYPSTVSPNGEEHEPPRIAPDYRQMSHFDGPPREYFRSTTARPESVRLEAPREYISRMQYLRPEPPLQGQELRTEMLPPTQREYSARPMEATSHRELYSVDRYYDAPSRVVSYPEHALANGGTNYYNNQYSRRVSDEFDYARGSEKNRHKGRDRRRPIENIMVDPARAREASVTLCMDEARRDVYR